MLLSKIKRYYGQQQGLKMGLLNHKCSYVLITGLLAGCGGSDSSSPAKEVEVENFAITSTANISATEDLSYTYQVVTSGANNPTYAIENNPSGMEISSSGLITWLPLEGVLTSGEVTITVTNSDATSMSQTFTIAVQPVNDQLELLSTDLVQTIDNKSLFSYQIMVSDADDQNNGQDITFELVSAPQGMTLSSTGLIEWQADIEESSDFEIDIAISDGNEDATETVNYSFSLDVLVYQDIFGTAVNYYTGEALDGVSLSLFSSESEVASSTTDETGLFQLKVLDTLLAAQTTLSASLSSFSEQSIIINANDILQNQHIALLPSHVTTSFDPSVAANIEYQGENLLEFSAASLVREDGQAIDGQVSAQVTIIDPSVDINVMPGDMVTMANDELMPIESFGAINVVLSDESGANINVAVNKQALIRIPVASNSTSAPETIPLYYFDEQHGIWVKEGEAEKVTLNGESYYQGQVSHFTTWNADRVYETVYIHGCVVDSENAVINGAKMISTGRDYNGSATAFSDENGQFTIAVKTNSTVLISGSQGSQSRTLSQNVRSEDITIEECIVLSPATSTVKLTWGENPRDLDTHFYGPSDNAGDTFHLYFGDKDITIGDTHIYLDVDDTSSFGPEVLTIPAFPFAGRYQYIVKKYAGSSDILESPTRVELNLESQIRIFSPPQGEATSYWHVFDFVVDENGEVTIDAINAWIDYNSLPSSFAVPQRTKPNLPNTLSKKSIMQKYYKSK